MRNQVGNPGETGSMAPKWWNPSLLSRDTPHKLPIVSLDLKGSSRARSQIASLDAARIAFRIIRDCIVGWSQECDSKMMFWAGDGGAFLFQPAQLQTDPGRFNALCFAIGVRFMTWSGVLNWTGLRRLASEANASVEEESEELRREFCRSVIAQTKEFAKKNVFCVEGKFQFSEILCSNKSWEQDSSNAEEHKKAGPLSFRIVCHVCELSIDSRDETIFGDDLNFVLKHERELGVPNGITITNLFEPSHLNHVWSTEELRCPRKSFDGKEVTLRIHPNNLVSNLKAVIAFGLSATHFESPREADEAMLVNRILACFDPPDEGTPHKAYVYNIGLGTFRSHLRNLWGGLMGRRGVSINVLLLKTYLNDEDKPTQTLELLKNVLKKATASLQQAELSELKELFRQRATLRMISWDDVVRFSKGKASELGPLFGCSMYFPDRSPSPVEGTNVFLTAPFSEWDADGYWRYRRAFYFSDVYALSYLDALRCMFESCWGRAELISEWPWPDVA
jgi:hypothetical protein